MLQKEKGICGFFCPIAITWANAMLGEGTPKMAMAISSSPARRILIPLSQENVEIMGMSGKPLPHLVQQAVIRVKEVLERV